MAKLFGGIIFIFLDVNLLMENGGVVGLLPDFIGYLMILLGMKELGEYSERFPDIRPYVLGMMAFSAVVYALDGLGITNMLGQIGLIGLKILLSAGALFITNRLIFALNDVEIALRRELNTISLMNSWRITAIFFILAYAMLLLPQAAGFSSVVFLATGLFFVFTFSKSVRLFYAK